MRLAILSGKGGTGKTTIATNLALSIGNVQLFDCDVEAPNASLFLGVSIDRSEDVTIPVPVFDKNKCSFCRECARVCMFHAIAVLPDDIMFFPELCHGCGGCSIICPEDCITEEPRTIGVIESGKVNGIEFYQGILNIGEPLATPVIGALKKRIDDRLPVILDAPPGTACPVIETVMGCDFGLLVTEPTPFGLHDLKLAVALMRSLEVPFGVIINRDGIGDERVDEFCKADGIEVMLKVPQDIEIARLYSRGIPFIKEMPEWKERFTDMFDMIAGRLKGGDGK